MPLSSLRVLDLSRLLPGPYCSLILADFGAEVIRVEPPGGGDWTRYVPPLAPDGQSVLFHAVNRGKKSLTLNLKAEEGRAVFLRLVGTADVLLESFRPGVMERLGLGYDRLAQENPRLVYCALSGYGPEGPYRERAGHDLNYIGLAGLLDLTGPFGGPPVVPGAPVADLAGALWAAVGILLALLDRERTGRGGRVDASLLGGALSLLPIAVSHLQGGSPMARGASTLTGGVVCYNVYPTADGSYMTLSALEPEFWAAFCRAVGREDWLDQQFAPAVPGSSVWEEMCALFHTRTRAEWAEALAGVDACCEPVYSLAEALDSPPVRALGMLPPVGGAGLLPPLAFSDVPAPALSPAPAPGEHTAAILAELGYDPDTVARWQSAGVI
ncbi:MAG: CoA transferase [Thermoflexales bacterium]|nr:CoA transferase [Thermoflexales bacterium]